MTEQWTKEHQHQVTTKFLNYTATYTDLYELVMAEIYFKKKRGNETVVYDYFFRKKPFNGGFAVFAGLGDLLAEIEDFCFSDRDIAYLRDNNFSREFLEYLKGFRFNGDIFALAEGDLVFPTMPILQVQANIIEAQIIETLLLNILNFQTLIATKARRIKIAAGERRLLDFGLRRAQGAGGYYASRAAVIGGFDGTSNVRAGQDYGIPVYGTMAHSFIQSYDDELAAFRDFAACRPNDCVLLVDTYNTLTSGIPNAIKVAGEMAQRGHYLKAIRLDSGDLAYLSRESRKMLNAAGLDYVKIAVSNQLDEYVIKSLLEQDAPIDIFGVGTSLVIGRGDAALDGVYKLACANGQPRIKISESINKISLPYKKQVYRLKDNDDNWVGADVITISGEEDVRIMYDPFDPYKVFYIRNFPGEELLKKVMAGGRKLYASPALEEIAGYSGERIKLLPPEYKRFENPHIYKIGISGNLNKERAGMIESIKRSYS